MDGLTEPITSAILLMYSWTNLCQKVSNMVLILPSNPLSYFVEKPSSHRAKTCHCLPPGCWAVWIVCNRIRVSVHKKSICWSKPPSSPSSRRSRSFAGSCPCLRSRQPWWPLRWRGQRKWCSGRPGRTRIWPETGKADRTRQYRWRSLHTGNQDVICDTGRRTGSLERCGTLHRCTWNKNFQSSF